MRKYKVESPSEWFIVETDTKRLAYSQGVKEWGRGFVVKVEVATEEDIKYFVDLKGEDAVRASA